MTRTHLCIALALALAAGAASAQDTKDKAKPAATKPAPAPAPAEKGRDWSRIDTNKDGYISPDEMDAWLKANPGPQK